jgi:hypothetical protein
MNFARVLALGVALTILISCSSPQAKWNQKVTITLSSPEQELVLAKVRGIRFEYSDPEAATSKLGLGSNSFITGEAVFADLPDGRLFLALLRGVGKRGDEGYNALFTAPKTIRGAAYTERVAWWKTVKAGTAFDLQPEGWPYMITAQIVDGKLADVVQVDPDDPILFGTSLSVTSVVLEKTRERPGEFELPDRLSCLKVLGSCSDFDMWPDQVGSSLMKTFIANGFPGKPKGKGLFEDIL